MELLPGEQLIFNLDSKSPDLRLFASDKVILTTHRVRYETKRFGYIQITSILLEQLASIQITQTSNPFLLIFALIIFLIGLLITTVSSGGSVALLVGVVIAVLLIIGYYTGRREVLVLTASGATIKIGLRRVGTQFTQKFMGEAEKAKDARYMIGKSFTPIRTP